MRERVRKDVSDLDDNYLYERQREIPNNLINFVMCSLERRHLLRSITFPFSLHSSPLFSTPSPLSLFVPSYQNLFLILIVIHNESLLYLHIQISNSFQFQICEYLSIGTSKITTFDHADSSQNRKEFSNYE